MDIYEILKTHNRPWSSREIVFFAVVLLVTLVIFTALVKRKKITVLQAAAGFMLLIFLGIVYASTVFSRMPQGRQYELELFWSWKEALGMGEGGSSTSASYLEEIILNVILLMPAGFLLPFVVGRPLRWRFGLLAGAMLSGCIEGLQLLLCRGLFEFDDILHNSAGCMIGCILGSLIVKRWRQA